MVGEPYWDTLPLIIEPTRNQPPGGKVQVHLARPGVGAESHLEPPCHLAATQSPFRLIGVLRSHCANLFLSISGSF